MGFPKKDKKFPHILHVYIPEAFQKDVDEAQKIAKREGESLSQKIVKYCVDYKNLHGHGNPQTLLPNFGVQKKIAQQCEYPRCSEVAVYADFARHGGTVYQCKTHHVHALENNLLKGSKRL
jgi:hypothetical protein